jgi:hypothetical protein
VVNLKDIEMPTKYHAENGMDDEPAPCDNDEPQYSCDSDSDNDNENPMLNYESDNSR